MILKIIPQRKKKIEIPGSSLGEIASCLLPHAYILSPAFEDLDDCLYDFSGALSVFPLPPAVILGKDSHNIYTDYEISIYVHECTHAAQVKRFGIFLYMVLKVFARFYLEKQATENEEAFRQCPLQSKSKA